MNRYSITIGMATPKGVRSFALAKDPNGTLCKYKEVQQEIESLRNSLQAAEILRDTYKATEEGWFRRYQILRDNLSPEEFGELCELWPELSPE